MLTFLKKIIAEIIGSYRNFSHRRKYDRLQKDGLNPFVCISNSGMQLTLEQTRILMMKGHMLVPNVSGFYHNILRMYWTQYGLGAKCLLVSETKAVGSVFASQYATTEFVTTDYYLQLQPNPECDVEWDLCSLDVPVKLNNFTSVINQATLEHVSDPVQVIRNLVEVLESDGLLYLQTHTPAFKYHGYPRDYLRYFPDWFIDLPQILNSIYLLELLCIDGHVFAVFKKK